MTCEGSFKKQPKLCNDVVFKVVVEADNKCGWKSCALSKNCKHKL